jgi:hypothetical protein
LVDFERRVERRVVREEGRERRGGKGRVIWDSRVGLERGFRSND